MRFALILALLIAVAAVVFALQNPADMTVRLGPYGIVSSTAIVLLVTFAFGALTGILTSLPGRWRASRRAKTMEKQLHTVAAPAAPRAAAPAAASGIPDAKIQKGGDADPYTARFGPPPHQV